MSDNSTFDPQNVDLDTADPTLVVCYLQAGGNEYNGMLGARVSALFVILIVSTAATFFPVLATRTRRFRIPLYVYLFARYFGAGVIIATAFVHLLDPAYTAIGPNTCVGMTGNWASYSWPPAIAMSSCMIIFLFDFLAEWYVERRFGPGVIHGDVQGIVTSGGEAGHAHHAHDAGHGHDHHAHDAGHSHDHHAHDAGHSHSHAVSTSGVVNSPSGLRAQPDTILTDEPRMGTDVEAGEPNDIKFDSEKSEMTALPTSTAETERGFREQIAAFVILEFGVLFHSVIIGLNLGVAGAEFSTLYPVLVFHQSFEGMGIGARLSVIPFPPRYRLLPWVFCAAYGLTTPVAIAIGLGLRTTYNSGSFTAQVVSGLFDSVSAGILIYTGLVELLARDFIFNPTITRNKPRIIFMLSSLYLGAATMALLGKWA